MNLYEINAKIERFIEDNVDAETGELLDVAGLDGLNIEKNEKVENIAMFIKNLSAEAEALKAEKDELAKRQKVAESKADRLKSYLSDCLDGEKFKSSRVEISWRKSEMVDVADVSVLDEQFTKVKIDADKTAIKKAIKSGIEVAGATLVQKNNMTIR